MNQKIYELILKAQMNLDEASRILEKEEEQKLLEPEQEPDRASLSLDFVEQQESGHYEPKIVTLPIDIKIPGKYVGGKARGVVVHYTAGRRGDIKEATATLKSMAESGLGCLVMDANGVIYKARNQNLLTDYSYHAGKSAWKGFTGISRYCIGMEICGAGLLDKNNKSWYGETFDESLVRTSKAKDNIRAGKYLAFTPAQEKSLINFIRWQLNTNPSFDPDWIVGHDEIAIPAGRKVDPGGSLSMTMPELRAMFKK
jgi:N-acetyl-anhydromuramyl-L-alanine amidase AmpD